LELLERVDTTILEAKLSSANQTLRAMPIVIGSRGSSRIQTGSMVAKFTAVAYKDRGAIVRFSARFTFLRDQHQVVTRLDRKRTLTSPVLGTPLRPLGGAGRRRDMCDPATVGGMSRSTKS
jgi:hypothetical protein